MFRFRTVLLSDDEAEPDFAETEVDTRRINLTRFELFFPEKRSFFLEGANLFEFSSGLEKNFIPFHSRRIGIGVEDELTIPIDRGAKLVGRAGRWGIAALGVGMGGTDATRSTRMFAGRATCDASDHLRVGTIATLGDPEGRQDTGLVGFDAVWHTTDFRGGKNLTASVWAAKSSGDLPADGDFTKFRRTGWGFKVDYPNDLWALSAQADEFGDALDARLGFLPRPGTRRTKLAGAYQPRPSGPPLDWARQFFYQLSASRVDDLEGSTESWTMFATPFAVSTRSGEHGEVSHQPMFDRLDSPYTPAPRSAPGVTIPPGAYRFTRYGAEFASADHRRWQAGGSLWLGGFYSGHLTQLAPYAGWNSRSGRLRLRLKGEADSGRFPGGEFALRLYQLQAVYAFSPDIVISSYTQYDSESRKAGMNNRLRFTIRPGRDLYVVWNRNWRRPSGDGPHAPTEIDDQVVVKLRWTFRW